MKDWIDCNSYTFCPRISLFSYAYKFQKGYKSDVLVNRFSNRL